MTIGSGGVLSVALAPNANSVPAGTYYKVVYKLDDGTTSTEYWLVPASGPTTIAAIRATVVPTQVAAQLASKQYVDSAVTNVVHVTGTESITGAKNFAVSPTAPDPSSASAVATKNYVDALFAAEEPAQAHTLETSGGTMTGPLFLAADPTSPTQATTRHYVDIQTATLTGGIASKLGRINDSPITLAGVRYADQFTGASVGGQIDAACADLSGANGVVVIRQRWVQDGLWPAFQRIALSMIFAVLAVHADRVCARHQLLRPLHASRFWTPDHQPDADRV